MSRRKPSPGVCGVCGHAVVRPTPKVLDDALDRGDTYGRPDVWSDGHHYVERKLVEVRCRDHEPQRGWDDLEVW